MFFLEISGSLTNESFFQQPNQLTYLEAGYGLLEERITNALSDSTGEAVQMGGSEDLLHLYWESVVPSYIEVIPFLPS